MSTTSATQITADEQNIQSLWTALQVAEKQLQKRGLAFGQAVSEYRAKSEVVQGGTSFRATLEKLNVPHSTAYFWIAKYEESIGAREPKPTQVAMTPVTPVVREEVEVEPSLEDRLDSIPPMTTEQRDQKELVYLVHRLESISIAIQQVADDNAKWSKFDEYKEVIALGKKMTGLFALLDTEDQLTPPPSPGARTKTRGQKTTARKTPVAKPKSATAIKRAVRFYTGMMEEFFALQEMKHLEEKDLYTHLLTLHGGDGRYPWTTPTKGYTLPPTKAEFDAEYDAAMRDFDALMADGKAEVTVTPPEPSSGPMARHKEDESGGKLCNGKLGGIFVEDADVSCARCLKKMAVPTVTPDQLPYRQLANPHTCKHDGGWESRKVGNINGRAMKGRPRLAQRTCTLCGASEGVIAKIARKATLDDPPTVTPLDAVKAAAVAIYPSLEEK
jgi:hypothetical protein